MFVSIYYKPSLFNAHTMIFIVHIFMNVNKICLNQREDGQKESWDLSGTVGLCREQPFALEYISWVLVVCLEGVVSEHNTFDCSPY